MKKNSNPKEHVDVEKKILLTKNILNNVYEILALFKPLFDLRQRFFARMVLLKKLRPF